jgi:hypothetical protein
MTTLSFLWISIYILLILVAIITVKDSFNKGDQRQAIAQIIVGLIVVVGFPFLIFQTDKLSTSRFDLYRNVTLLEYYELRAEEMQESPGFPGFPRDVAIATRSTPLRSGPSSADPEIRQIQAGEQVKLFIRIDFVEELMNEHKRGEWVKVNAQGDVGWVSGYDFRIMAEKELDQQVLSGLDTAVGFVFPDRSLFGMLKTILIATGISILGRFIGRYIEFIDRIHAVFPAAYFIVTGWEGRTLTFVEYGMTFWALIFLLAFVEGISYLILRILFRWE